MPELTKEDLAMIRTCLIWTRVATSGPLRKQLTELINKIQPVPMMYPATVVAVNTLDSFNVG